MSADNSRKSAITTIITFVLLNIIWTAALNASADQYLISPDSDIVTEYRFDAPDILGGQEIDVEYVSPMALAQKGQELSSIIRGLEIFGQIGAVAPVTDYIDPQGLVKEIIKILGIPAKIIRSDAEVQEITEEKQAAQQQQMDMMNAVQESQVAKNVAPAVQALDEANRQQ